MGSLKKRKLLSWDDFKNMKSPHDMKMGKPDWKPAHIGGSDDGGEAYESKIDNKILDGYKWKPSASQRKAFAEKMKDPAEQAAYNERKRLKHSYEGFKDKEFVPTKMQRDYAAQHVNDADLTPEQKHSFENVMASYDSNVKTHHKHIHAVNAHMRGERDLEKSETE